MPKWSRRSCQSLANTFITHAVRKSVKFKTETGSSKFKFKNWSRFWAQARTYIFRDTVNFAYFLSPSTVCWACLSFLNECVVSELACGKSYRVPDPLSYLATCFPWLNWDSFKNASIHQHYIIICILHVYFQILVCYETRNSTWNLLGTMLLTSAYLVPINNIINWFNTSFGKQDIAKFNNYRM